MANLDAVTLEVIRNALPAVANEMAADLQRTSYNMMIYEVRDFCTALVGLDGELISQNVGGVSHFVADLGVIITDGLRRYGKAGFKPAETVLVATVRALKMHGGVAKEALGPENLPALEAGLSNLARHIANLRKFGVPVTVAINRFDSDSAAELAFVAVDGVVALDCQLP